MAYRESTKKATIKYIQGGLKSVTVRWKIDFFNDKIAPAIERSGKPYATFIKEAVEEKIARDGL